MKAAAASQLTSDRVHPPDKRKFERETAEITRQIKDLEAKLVSFLSVLLLSDCILILIKITTECMCENLNSV